MSAVDKDASGDSPLYPIRKAISIKIKYIVYRGAK